MKIVKSRTMKYQLIVFTLIMARNSHSQQLSSFQPLRYDEDYAILQNDSSKTFYNKLKYAPFSDNRNTYISFGGEARLQYLYYKNDLWSDAPEATHGDVLNRYLLHGDFHSGKHFRTFVQLQSSLAFSMEQASPVDDNSLELHQAFFDVKTSLNGNIELTARAGRQEFYYGSQRLISTREGPNNRQSFDGLKVILKKKDLNTDIFYSHYVMTTKGFFNDRLSGNTKLWGMYVTKNGIPIIENIDLYYLGLFKRRAAFDNGAGQEIRHSAGTRIWKSSGEWKYDFEAVYQSGKMDKKTIRAWTASLNTSYTFSKTKFTPRAGLKAELISGNRNYDDNTLRTFNPLFPRGGYFGLAGLIGAQNLMGIHPSFSLTPATGVSISLDHDVLWRYSINDGIYAPGNTVIYSGRNAKEKHIGNQYSLILDYSINRFIYVGAVFTWFDAGQYLKEVSAGKDIFFTGITAQVKF